MIKLYTANTPNGIKIPMALEEIGIDYEFISVDLSRLEQKSASFLAINPNGRVPSIIDTDVLDSNGDPISVFESGAILLYLAEKSNALQGDSSEDRVRMLEWLFFQMSAIGPIFGQVNYFRSSSEYPSQNAVLRFQAEANRLAGILDSRLSGNEWLAGSHFTIADIANYGWLQYTDAAGIDIDFFTALKRWRESIDARMAIKRGLERLDAPDGRFGDHTISSSKESNIF